VNLIRYPLFAMGAFLVLLTTQPVFAFVLNTESDREKPTTLSTTDADNKLAFNTKKEFNQADELVPNPQDLDYSFDRHRLGILPFDDLSPDSKLSAWPISSHHLSQTIAQTMAQTPSFPPSPPAGAGVLVPQPEIIIKSNGTANPDILQTNAPVAPELPRAIAPPVGDMAISNINAAPVTVDLGAKVIVPRLVLRKAPAKEVLAVLARYAGLNLIFDDSSNTQTPGETQGQAQPPGSGNAGGGEPTVSLDLQNEPVSRIFNSVLLISGLQATRQGNTIFVGKRLNSNIRNLITRTIRLNQAPASDAASFLALQGAVTNIFIPATIKRKIDKDTREVTEETTEPKIIPLEVDKTRAASGTNLLTGLQVSSDPRLNLVTLVGEPRLVQIATSLLTQIDARRRQVALNVKIVDINLNNIQDYNSSFSFGINDSFFIQDNGAAVMRFGSTSPVRKADIASGPGRVLNPPSVLNPLSSANTFINTNDIITVPNFIPGAVIIDQSNQGTLTQLDSKDAQFFGRIAGVSQNPTLAGITNLTQGTADVFTRTVNPDGTITTNITRGTLPTALGGLPSYFQYPQKFQALIDAQIRSGTAKILTDPTIVVQESQQASVNLTQSVVSSVNSQVDPLSGVRTTTPVFSNVGLTLTVDVDRIDDNGFVSVKVKPQIASPGGQQTFESGVGSVNTITLINTRQLSSGQVRLRDGQTMILSGIISETDQSTVSKVPILGDIPILGALFRSSSDQKDRSEVIILLTPQIIDDNSQSQFGYNYSPGKEAAGVLRDKGFPVQVQP